MPKDTKSTTRVATSERRARWLRIGSVTLICLPLIAVLLLLKAGRPALPSMPTSTQSADGASTSGGMATPDTSTSIEHRAMAAFAIADTTYHTPTSHEMIDQRTPSKSGTEDGYWDGYYDGTARQSARQHFNDSSDYDLATQRHTYSTHYAEGYELGYTNGARTP